MSRVSEEELKRLKSEVSVARLAEARGVVLRKRGEELIGLCPFHDDHSPSLVVNLSKNLWHCLGACQTGGSVIDWVMKAEGVSFRHAVELLRRDALALDVTPAEKRGPKKATIPKLGPVVELDADVQQQLGQVIDYYHETLKQSPEALAYLESRGLQSSEAIDQFRLGFSNRTLGYHIPFRNRADGGAIRDNLQQVGILRKTGHEHFRGSLVIPVFDEAGQVTEVYGRKIGVQCRKDIPLHLYLPGPHRGVWNVAALRASSEIILCESLIDALTFWCAGYRNVTASYGIEGFTDDHLEAFRLYGIERVLIAYDRDESGEKAASSLAEKLIAEEGIECFRIQFPKGMDANAYALQVKPAEKSLGIAIRNAGWLGRGERQKGEEENGSNNPRVSGAESVATVDVAGAGDIRIAEETPPGGAVCAGGADAGDSDVDTDEYSGGPGKREPGGVCVVSIESAGESIGAGDDSLDGSATELSEAGRRRAPDASDAGNTSTDSGAYRRCEKQDPIASPVAAPPSPVSVQAVVENGEVTIKLGDRRWRIRGLEKNMSFEQLRVNVLCGRGDAFHVDTFDLYVSRHRQSFLKQASEELETKEDILKKDLGKVLLKLEALQEKQINQTLNPGKAPAVTLSDAEQGAAMDLLKDPQILGRILTDFESCGIVGEEINKLLGYLAAVSRKLEEPLAVVIQSSSAAGKSSLMEAILSFLPPEEQVKYSAMTGQSLFYMGETDLQHKILAIVEEEGAERAAYALKLLQSEGELTIASTGKDPSTGRLVTQEYRVEGPVMIFLTTTAIEIDEELLNRCIVLTVDEDRSQTQAIHRLQRERQTLGGLLARRDSDKVKKVHQNAHRLLRPLLVANPYAEELTFLDDRTRTRRDHMKYLTLIRSIALLHQYQRPIHRTVHDGKTVQYIEVTLEDIETANRLCHQVLGRSLDELSPQTRRLLMQIDKMAKERCRELEIERSDYRFTQREVREWVHIGNTQLKVHLSRLVELEYVLVHQGGRGQQFIYELVYDGRGEDGTPFVPGLLDVSKLQKCEYDAKWSGEKGEWSDSGRPQVGPKSGGCRGVDRPVLSNDSEENAPINGKSVKIAHLEEKSESSYLPLHTDNSGPRSLISGPRSN